MGFEKLADFLDSLASTYRLPSCDCIVYHKHEQVFRRMCGYSDKEKKTPVSPKDLYWLFSATKVVTATAVMRLVEQGKLSLADEVSRYLPEYADVMVRDNFRYDANLMHNGMVSRETLTLGGELKLRAPASAMTIEDLLTMSGGLGYDMETPAIKDVLTATNGKAGTREIVRAIAKTPLDFDPGTHFQYSLCHDVLAAVVEVVSGMTYGEFLEKELFGPLGMEDMGFKMKPEQLARLSALYTCNQMTWEHEYTGTGSPYRRYENYESGGGGLFGKTDSYVKLLDALCNDGMSKDGYRVLKPETIENMRTNRMTGSRAEDFLCMRRYGYGYGLGVRTMVDNSKAKSPIGEFGWDSAGGAFALVDTKNSLAVFYAQHVLSFRPGYYVIHPTVRDLTYEALFG
ncbi:MAG: beta-lactamase family protein [Oscillospiraceae bacterium]|jgi:CubicO group peptidase (beta-lactamase class C family)|nr:beta-lactamase family protein [Oscillospiraceae bacterium]